jgi:1,4-alpha-glucan branching enzyme
MDFVFPCVFPAGALDSIAMILTKAELDALTQVRCRDPHQFLGMHRLGEGQGVVVRAFLPQADSVTAVPTHEKGRPAIPLKKIHEAGVFEGTTRQADEIYAYDLEISGGGEGRFRTRDPYSFLPTLGETDIYLFSQGNENRIYEKLGAQLRRIDGVDGASFAVWAPNATRVSVVAGFNEWDGRCHPMRSLGPSGVWEIFIPGVREGSLYKYEIRGQDGSIFLKTDPFGFFFEAAPKNASIVWNTQKFGWTDQAWMERRSRGQLLREPLSIYEVHLGSWRKKSPTESLSYRELAAPLIDYVREMGFTHVEFLPVAEHAFYPSWGYQVTGFYSPTSRFGTPDDFQSLVNQLHEAGIGVIIDWVPAHFPRDDWALAKFDGTALYEHADPKKGAHQDWGTLIFNFGRHEVRNFLAANALFWCDRYHVDGLRVDAVASMLYLDYSRKEGEWIPNEHGGRENIEAVSFLQHFNHVVHTSFPGVLTVAEESTSWPRVTRPPYLGGLGFSLKWNMGWMHDTLAYFSRDTIHRKYHQSDLTFAMLYHHHENFLLPLSHDEVVHGKGSLLRRMPGDEWRRFANLRLLFGYQWLFPGKKLLFMGDEFGQSAEWDANGELEWNLLRQGPFHCGARKFVADLNRMYQREPALWQGDFEHAGFRWVDCDDVENSVLSFARSVPGADRHIVAILNLTPVPREGYRIGLPKGGFWTELINSDAEAYGGGNLGNLGGVQAADIPAHRLPFSATFLLPPLSVVAFRSPD